MKYFRLSYYMKNDIRYTGMSVEDDKRYVQRTFWRCYSQSQACIRRKFTWIPQWWKLECTWHSLSRPCWYRSAEVPKSPLLPVTFFEPPDSCRLYGAGIPTCFPPKLRDNFFLFLHFFQFNATISWRRMSIRFVILTVWIPAAMKSTMAALLSRMSRVFSLKIDRKTASMHSSFALSWCSFIVVSIRSEIMLRDERTEKGLILFDNLSMTLYY